jgi:hypothetical protein
MAFVIANSAVTAVAGQIPAGTHDQAKTSLETVVALREILITFDGIVNHSAPLLKGTLFEEVPYVVNGTIERESRFCKKWTAEEIEDIRASLQRLRVIAGQTAVEKHPIYSKAITTLEDRFLTSTELSTRWLHMCGSAFFEDVQKKEPAALMILLHWGVVFSHMSMWWAQSSAKRLVEQLTYILQPLNSTREWKEAVSWSRNWAGLAPTTP